MRGREDFSITENRDRTASLAAIAITDNSKSVRDVVYTKARDGRPKDMFIRFQAGGLQRRTFYYTSTLWNGTDGPLGRMETYRITALDDATWPRRPAPFPAVTCAWTPTS